MVNEVLIIGAGFAGAACALRLSEHGIKSTIIEARKRTGGRVDSVTLAPGVVVDFGASNVHGYGQPGNPAQRLAEKLGVQLDVAKPGPGLVFGKDKKQVPADEVGRIQTEIGRVMAHQADKGEADVSLGSRAVDELRSVSPHAEGLARTAELGAGIRLEQVSARYWKTEKGYAGVDALPAGGYAQIIDKAIQQSGAEILLQQEVTAIQQTAGAVKVTTKTGKACSADHVIVTIPIAVLQHNTIRFDPPLPTERQTLISRTSVGLLDKFSLLYPSVWWPRRAGNFVFLPSTDEPFTASSSPLDILEASTIMVANMHAIAVTQPPVLLLYLPPHAAFVLEHISDAAFTPIAHEYVLSRLSSTSSSSSAPQQPTSGRMARWGADPYARGATTSPIALGKDAQPDDLTELGRPLWDGKLGFAGEGTDRHLRGSVPGAVASGEREADRLVKLLKA